MGTQRQFERIQKHALDYNTKRIEHMNVNVGTSFATWLFRLHAEIQDTGGPLTSAYASLGKPYVDVLACVRAFDSEELSRLADFFTPEKIAAMPQWGRLIRVELPPTPEHEALFALAWRVRNAMKGEAVRSGPATEEETAEALRTTALPHRLPYIHQWAPLKVVSEITARARASVVECFHHAEKKGLPYNIEAITRKGYQRRLAESYATIMYFWAWVERVKTDSLRRFPRVSIGRQRDVIMAALQETKAFEILDFAPALLYPPALAAHPAWRGSFKRLRVANSVYCHIMRRMRGGKPPTQLSPESPVGLNPRHQDKTVHVGSCITDGRIWNDFYDKVEQYHLSRTPVAEGQIPRPFTRERRHSTTKEGESSNRASQQASEPAAARHAKRLFAAVSMYYVRAPSLLGLSAIRAVIDSLDVSQRTSLDVMNALDEQRVAGSHKQVISLLPTEERRGQRRRTADCNSDVEQEVDPSSIARPFLAQVAELASEHSGILAGMNHARRLRFPSSHLGPHQDKIYDYVQELCAGTVGYSVLRLIDDPVIELSVFLTIRALQQGADPSVYRDIFDREHVQCEAGLKELPSSRTDSETMPMTVLEMQQKHLLSAKVTSLSLSVPLVDRLPWLELAPATVKIMKAYRHRRQHLTRICHVLDELALPGSVRQVEDYFLYGEREQRSISACKAWLKRSCHLLEAMRHWPDADVVQRLGKHGPRLLRALLSMGFTWDTDIRLMPLHTLIEAHAVLTLAMDASYDLQTIAPLKLTDERKIMSYKTALSQLLLGHAGQATMLRLPALGYPTLMQAAAAKASRHGLQPFLGLQLDAAGVPLGVEQGRFDGPDSSAMAFYVTPLPADDFRTFLTKVLECQANGNLSETYCLGYHESSILEALETLKLTPAAVSTLDHTQLEAAHSTLSAAMRVSPQNEPHSQLHSQQRNIYFKTILRKQLAARLAGLYQTQLYSLTSSMPYYGTDYPVEMVALLKEAAAAVGRARPVLLLQLYLLEHNYSVSIDQVASILAGLKMIRTTGERHILDVATSRPAYEKNICGAAGFRQWLVRVYSMRSLDVEDRTYRQGPHAQVYQDILERHVFPQFPTISSLRKCTDKQVLYSIHQQIQRAITDTGPEECRPQARSLDSHLYSRMPMCGFFTDETHRQIMTDAWETLDTRMWLLTKHGYPGNYEQLQRLPMLPASRTEKYVEPSSEFRTWILSCMQTLAAGTPQDVVLGSPVQFQNEFMKLVREAVSVAFIGACSDDALYSIYDTLSAALLMGADDAPAYRPSPTETTLWLSREKTAQRMRSSVHKKLLEDATQQPATTLLLEDASTAMITQCNDSKYLTLRLARSLNAHESQC
eukprot:Rhum_TRINITY_DN15486_c5_g1::Rhum_TRINITY_DN15486_c5_g1_i1::g.159405::m.159405